DPASSDSGILVQISFTSKTTDGTSPLDLNNVYVLRGTDVLPSSSVNGQVVIEDTGGNACLCDFCLDLEAGLNFVSIPKTIDASDISGITIFDIDQFSGEQVQYFNPHDGWDSNPDVLPCRGFQVLKNAPLTVCVDFVTDSQPQQELYEGWNMIGHVHTEDMVVYEPGNIADFTTRTGLESPEDNLLFMQLNTYSQTTGWSYYPDDFSDMTPGLGYYILMKQDTTMYGMQ
ncbi:MAG: hypothetical protein MIO93_13060, partial [ANME-2 cluster archaeon]|nr:hypothetical protein [ANME-2 cluster archaeon]